MIGPGPLKDWPLVVVATEISKIKKMAGKIEEDHVWERKGKQTTADTTHHPTQEPDSSSRLHEEEARSTKQTYSG
jgi:hypothetical protein